jgi:hypothetical protein
VVPNPLAELLLEVELPVPVEGVAFVLALAAFAAPLLAGGMSALKFVGIV